MTLNRFLPLSGIVFVLIVVGVVVLTSEPPGSTASAAEVASFYAGHEVEQWVGAFVFAAAAPFLVVFAASVAAAFGGAGGPRSQLWERVLVAGGALAATTVLVTALLHFGLADGDVSPTAMQALNVLEGNMWVAWNPALGVMMLGAAGLTVPRAPRLGWPALVLGVALFVPFADFVALLLTGPWIVVTGVVLVAAGSGERRGELALGVEAAQ
jgi:hypothetical protein